MTTSAAGAPSEVDAASIENILAQLLQPDNTAIQKATEALNGLHNNPNFIPSLCSILGNSASPQVRQYAAVVLRRKIVKKKSWSTLSESVIAGLKAGVFDRLITETQSAVKKSIAELIGTIAYHCRDLNEWPQLLEFFTEYAGSSNATEKEVAMSVLKTVSAEASDQLSPHMSTVLQLCSSCLYDNNPTVCYYSIVILNNMVCEVSSDDMAAFSNLVPRILDVVKLLAGVDEEQACEAMEIFDSLVECEVAVLHPHVKTIVNFGLSLAVDEEMPDALRVKSLECVSWLVTMKKKAIQKMNLVQPILDAVFSLMCRCSDEDEDLEDTEETEKAATYAARIMDSLALHLPAEKIVTQVVKNSSLALQSGKPSERKAGYIALGIIAEGCSDHISNKYLQEFLNKVVEGFGDPHAGVRNGAMFALGQFSEYLQPAITKYASQIIPLLLSYAMGNLEGPNPSLATLTRTYYALEAYAENLEKDVFPFLPDLMSHFLLLLSNSEETELSEKLKEFSLSCISSIACAAKSNMNPYFNEMMNFFKHCLSDLGGDKMKDLQLQSVETLGIFARELDEESFTEEVCNMCIQLGLSLIQSYNDPDVRRCVYTLFSALSTLKTADLVGKLDVIVNYMLTSLKNSDGVKVHYSVEESAIASQFNFDSLPENAEMDDDDDEDDLAGITIESPYLDEKEDACTALSDLAIHYYEHFMPYMVESYRETCKLEEFGSPDVLKASLKAMSNFAIAAHDCHKKTGDQSAAIALKEMLSDLELRYTNLVLGDKDRSVAMTALHCMQELLEGIGLPVLQISDNSLNNVRNIVLQVLKGKTVCQDEDSDDDEDADAEQAEYDTLLLEYAAGIIPALGKLLTPETYDPVVQQFMPLLTKRCKLSSTPTEKAFSIGTIAECMEVMKPGAAEPYANQLLSVISKAITNSEEEVRNNSIFALGVLCARSANVLESKYLEFLQTLGGLAGKETSPGVRDNIAAATCRILMSGHAKLPVDEVYSVLMNMLPLTFDFAEYAAVLECLVKTLYANYKSLVMQDLLVYLTALSDAVETTKLTPESLELVMAVCNDLKLMEPERLQHVVSVIGSDSKIWKLFPAGV